VQRQLEGLDAIPRFAHHLSISNRFFIGAGKTLSNIPTTSEREFAVGYHAKTDFVALSIYKSTQAYSYRRTTGK